MFTKRKFYFWKFTPQVNPTPITHQDKEEIKESIKNYHNCRFDRKGILAVKVLKVACGTSGSRGTQFWYH
jgi:hypothetical protein